MKHNLLRKEEDSDPISVVSNLFDIAMVFAVALMVALVSRYNMTEVFSQEDYTMVKNPGKENMEIITKEGNKINRTDLYTAYDKTIKELELPLMKTFIPDTKRYKKELVADKKAVFRSTLFPASRPLVRGSNLEELITEIVYYIKLK